MLFPILVKVFTFIIKKAKELVNYYNELEG